MEKKTKKFAREIALQNGITAKLENGILNIKGPKGEIERSMHRNIKVSADNSSIKLEAKKSDQRDKKIIGSLEAHIKNMAKGAAEGHMYTLKICSGHFPMNVSVAGNKLTVKNFLGEKVPRALEFSKNAKVSIDGEHIHVESADKEAAGQTAADIEQLTRRPGFDTRVFQDGIYITNKDGKEIR